ncbi:hypothetical protein AAFF_G00363530 [Aldrovandia affinis]|uniref:Uncharacterized protein n=1 Tax=Aldrovandia affinis TaxID=143900 RepID=A0AAD7SJL4_9TELE|nr:hypothetical protein AAFF_G00363530 [Aldrovandia affinis]
MWPSLMGEGVGRGVLRNNQISPALNRADAENKLCLGGVQEKVTRPLAAAAINLPSPAPIPDGNHAARLDEDFPQGKTGQTKEEREEQPRNPSVVSDGGMDGVSVGNEPSGTGERSFRAAVSTDNNPLSTSSPGTLVRMLGSERLSTLS